MVVAVFSGAPIGRALALLLISLAAAITLGLACSAVLELQACESDGDCPDGGLCSADGLCADPIVDAPDCSTDEDCLEGFLCGITDRCIDASAQCEDDGDCEPLFGASGSCDDGLCTGETALVGGPCQRLHGAAGDDGAIRFGVVLQLTGVGGGFGQPMLDAIRIATRDINNLGGIGGRPIGLVACDTQGSNDTAQEAAQHLVDNAGVAAIIGFNSSQTLAIAPTLLRPEQVLLMSPSATAQAITYLEDDDLIWRTAPSDEHQAMALGQLVDHLVDDYLPAQGIAEPTISVLVRRQDQWADSLRDGLVDTLGVLANDDQRFSTYQFANVGIGEVADYTDVAAEVASQPNHPDLVVVLGSADAWQVIGHVDSVLPGDPLFVGADAMKNLEEAAEADPSLQGRIWGTGPRTAAELDYQPYTIFRLKFEQELNADADNFQFVANAFDALYTLAFASAAAIAEADDAETGDVDPVRGPTLASGLTRLAQGDQIRPSAADAAQAISILLDGGTINYAGASGPINFDANGDPEPMPIALWCFDDGQVPEIGELYTPDGQFTPLSCE